MGRSWKWEEPNEEVGNSEVGRVEVGRSEVGSGKSQRGGRGKGKDSESLWGREEKNTTLTQAGTLEEARIEMAADLKLKHCGSSKPLKSPEPGTIIFQQGSD
ncbi:hypothetical protein PPACK8108_LOCUS9047 [Phakopsora pachyrhizi]|uniref:Uncharacterized protein n=1 Tax=Phakopsora pachyrhizi TaxID=170000 RepID=A0AAV0AVU1_PHAPC|nr:hypothetical protein PPACK8108_LOCUS9047 [Phakopsora pachyrhizi]